MATLKQVMLSQPNGTSKRYIVGWLEADRNGLKVRQSVKLKDGPQGWWEVVTIYKTARATESIKHDWKVGGLQ